MPERLDRVAIQLSNGTVVISWEDRQELLMRMDTDTDAGRSLNAKFEAVGATREVTPDLEEKKHLRWLLGGPQPPGLDALRAAFDEDLHDVEQRADDS